jgi:hypothetical protein
MTNAVWQRAYPMDDGRDELAFAFSCSRDRSPLICKRSRQFCANSVGGDQRESGNSCIIIVQAWPKGSLEEVVQNLVKTWEMELSHKTEVSDFKTIDHEKFTIAVNGEPQPEPFFLSNPLITDPLVDQQANQSLHNA